MSFGPRPWVQQHWDIRAAANFVLGGTGAGLLATLGFDGRAPFGWVFLCAGLALVGTGLGAVWLEIGRKLRFAHVFFNPRTSWMTRESYAAILLFALGLGALLRPALVPAVAAAALVFVWCQGRILRASKGIPAWRLPEVTALILATGLVEGAGLYLAASILAGAELRAAPAGFFALLVVLRALSWSRYAAALARGASREVQARLEPAGRSLVQLGSIAALALLLAGVLIEGAAQSATVLAGLLAVATGWRLKFVLVTGAALNQGFALPRLPVRGTR